ncbi:nitrilase family protein [Antarctobacter heliothermus]|uniref:Predicted amidohydrolase n=1 Tax=Antarctobacter heliothermus TaxID=74033 RepID=A0A239B3V5_9RHOB|nr:nitrilase family protein [Antarctobacter heliothermus]SNS01908.1 Predicted amidohydrolase [Antarctobacter heliothermus]
MTPGTSSRTFKIAVIQYQPEIGALTRNLAAMEDRIRKAHAAGAALIVLPELADSGYVFETEDEVAALSGPIPDGRSATMLCDLAVELGVYIASGLAEAADGTFYNSAILCGPEGYLGTYRKLHLWNREKLFFAPGNLGLPVFDTSLGRIGLAVCYDGWFPETFRTLADNGAEIVCVPTNWVPMPDQEPEAEAMANTLHKAAAHSNGLYIACADRVGTERGQPFIGQSLIVGPNGFALAGPADRVDEAILIAEVDPGRLSKVWQVNEFNNKHSDRRRDVYS